MLKIEKDLGNILLIYFYDYCCKKNFLLYVIFQIIHIIEIHCIHEFKQLRLFYYETVKTNFKLHKSKGLNRNLASAVAQSL